MAVNRNGRVLYVDAPGTYNAVFPATESARLDEVRLLAGSDAAALYIYDDVVATDNTRKIAGLVAPANTSDDFVIASDEEVPPECKRGMTIVLTGTAPVAFIYLR